MSKKYLDFDGLEYFKQKLDAIYQIKGNYVDLASNQTITGNKTLSGTTDVSGGTIKLKTINAPTSSGGTTYGPGTSGYVLKSNGTTVYWATDNNSTSYLSYSSTSRTNTDTNVNYLIGKYSVSSSGTTYYNSNIYFKGNSLYASNMYPGVIKSTSNTNYGLVLPATSSWTANKTIATTDIFNPVMVHTSVPTSSSNKFVFTISSSYNFTTGGGLGVFTFGYCTSLISLYGLTSGQTYKTVGTFIYDSSGSVVTTTINYKYTKSGSTHTLEIWSGNSDRKIQNGYSGYLYLVKLV